MGSTLVARSAGIAVAANATAPRIPGTAANVAASIALTPNNRVAITRVTANAPASPAKIPIRNDRRLFQYRFPVHLGSAVLSPDSREAAIALGEELWNAGETELPVPLRSKNAEGWYVRAEPHTKGQRILAFTTENGTSPPPKLTSVFHALESAVPETEPSRDGKDICFGFCYDPLAGLGIVFMNNRCHDRNGTHCK